MITTSETDSTVFVTGSLTATFTARIGNTATVGMREATSVTTGQAKIETTRATKNLRGTAALTAT